MSAVYLTTDPDFVQEAWQVAALFDVSIASNRQATVTIPTGTVISDYEYLFRPAPTVSATRSVDMSLFLAPGESASDYEFQLRS